MPDWNTEYRMRNREYERQGQEPEEGWIATPGVPGCADRPTRLRLASGRSRGRGGRPTWPQHPLCRLLFATCYSPHEQVVKF